MVKTLFSKTLFWDTDVSKMKLEKSRFYIVERIITRGEYQDWKIMLSLYTKLEIVEIITKIKELDPKTLNFCSFYFNLPKEAFRCYMKKPWTEQLTNY